MIRIEFMTEREVKRTKIWNESLLEGYRLHNMHGCYDNLIEECQKKIKRCEKRIKELNEKIT